MEPYKVLKNLRPNKEYADFLREIASKIAVLEEPISPEMIKDIKDLSKNTIKQGEEEKRKYDSNKKEFFKTAMNVSIQKYEKSKD